MSLLSADQLEEAIASPAWYDDPYPVYGQLRTGDPVHWSETLGGWVLTRYDDVVATLRAPQHYSSRGRFLSALANLPADGRARLRPLEDHFAVGLISADPPDHQRLRTLVSAAFTPRVVEALRPRIQQLVDQLLVAAQERGSLDIVRDLAYPLPATVIAELLGVPAADRHSFKRWSEGIISFQGTGRATTAVFERAQGDLLQMRAYLGDLLAARRAAPAEDLLGQLVAAEAVGDRLSEAELLTLCVNLLTAGHETTTNLIANGMLSLLRHPDQRDRLLGAPALIGTAIEEMLRYESPLQRNLRRVSRDIELRGKLLRQDDLVIQLLGAANRDPEQFIDPDRFDIGRQPNRQIAFGYGIHFCVGAPLARLEVPIAIGALLRRWPRMELAAGPVRWQPHWPLRSLMELPVAF